MAVISHWLPPYYLWWKLVAFFEEDQHRLCQLMVLNGFFSNPDIPGTEKLCVSVADPSWLASPKKGFGSGWMWHAWWWHSPPRKFLLCQGVASLSVLPCSALVFFQIWRVLPGSQFDIHSILRSWNTTCFKFTYNSRCLFVSNWSFCWQVLPEDVKKPLRKT